MKKIIFLGIVLCLAFPESASAKKRVYVYDHEKKDSVAPNGDTLPPNRILYVFSERLDGWAIARTDDVGDISEPLQAMQSGSVVLGVHIGASSPKDRFVLTPEGGFEPTKSQEHEDLLVLAEKPFWRTVDTIRR